MMGAAIDAGDDRVGGSLELVVEAALDQPAEYWIGWLLAVQSERADVRLMPAGAHGLVHRLDDVAADAELAEGRFEPGLQRPAGWGDRSARPSAFEFRCPAEQQAAQLRVLGVWPGPKIDDAAAFVGDIAQRPVEARPSICLRPPAQGPIGFRVRYADQAPA